MKTIPSHGSCFMAKVSHMIYTWCSASPLAARYGLWRRADFWAEEPIPLEVTPLMQGVAARVGQRLGIPFGNDGDMIVVL